SIFCITSHVIIHDTHSFPTRRSSDLLRHLHYLITAAHRYAVPLIPGNHQRRGTHFSPPRAYARCAPKECPTDRATTSRPGRRANSANAPSRSTTHCT